MLMVGEATLVAKAYNLNGLEILGFLEICVMQTPTGLFMKYYYSTLALHWT
jgi:hypothetical protein